MTMTFCINTMITAMIGYVPHMFNTETGYVMVLAISVVYGMSLALLQLTLYGIAGPSPALTTAFMVGNGLSSLLVNCLRIFVLIFISDLAHGATIFFGISTAFLAFCSYLAYSFVSLKQEIDRDK